MTARYAVYFSPDDTSPLASYGECVLGRTADGQRVAPSSNGFPDQQRAHSLAITPAHYGFHATLKAPFRLKPGMTEVQLLDAVEALACQFNPIPMESLAPGTLGSFVALCFEHQPLSITELAAGCVKTIEPYRAALTEEEFLRRQPKQLTDRQKNYLELYGYPFVLEEFQFHMTLTGKMDLAENTDYIEWLAHTYQAIVPDTPTLDRLAIFWQPDKASAFKRLAQFPLK